MQTTQATLKPGLAVWEAVLEHGCGLDVHQKTVTAYLLIGPMEEQPREFLHTFPTTRGLLTLRDWLQQNGWLKCILVQTAHASCRTKGTYLKSFYHRVAARRGKCRAIVAVVHKQVRAIYHELSGNKSYHELGGDFFDRLNQKALEQRLTRRLEELGYRVELTRLIPAT